MEAMGGRGPITDEEAAMWVEIETVSPQITGRVHRDDEEPVTFAGWIELLSVLTPD